jgi:hypothetical protein
VLFYIKTNKCNIFTKHTIEKIVAKVETQLGLYFPQLAEKHGMHEGDGLMVFFIEKKKKNYNLRI